MGFNKLTLPKSEEKSKIKLSTAALMLTFAVAFLALICLGVGVANDSNAEATPFTIDGVEYTPTGENTVSVTGNSLTTLTDVIIPSTVENSGVTYTVTAIGKDVFLDCYKVKSAIIPDSVTSIGEGAFNGCLEMVSVTIGNGVTSIGEGAFSWCDALTSVTIPESVTFIDRYAFEECEYLTEINFNAVNCSDLTDDSYVFGDSGYDGTGINVTIGDSVTKVPAYLFTDTEPTYIISVTLGSNVTSIGTNAFYNCTELKTVYNRSFIDIVKGSDANGYIAYYADEVYGKVHTESQDDMTIKYNDLSEKCFLSAITSPREDYVLTDVMIGINSYQFIGFKDGLFAEDTVIKSMVLGDGFTVIKNNSFDSCSSLVSVSIGNNVTSIGNEAFYKCSSLASLIIGNKVKTIGENAFCECTSLISVTIPDSVTSIGAFAFSACTSLNSATLGSSVTSIGNFAFKGCSSMTSIAIPESVTSIGENAFYKCSSLGSVTIPDSVTSIGAFAFSECTSLESVSIGDGVQTIDGCTFDGCTLLKSVTIGSSVSAIKDMAFYNCSSLVSVIVENETPADLVVNAFEKCPADMRVFVPLTANAAYKAADGWKDLNIYSCISKPQAEEDLEYNSTKQTGVVDNANYSRDGDYEATNAGNYKATVTPKTGYVWSDYTEDVLDLDWSIAKKDVTVAGTTVEDKTYDGNVTATVGTFGTLQGVIGTDEVTISAATGEFDNKNVGNDKDVTVKYTLSGKDADNYTAMDYDTCASINQKEVKVGGITANNKAYDGNTNAELDYSSVTGFITGDTVTVSANGAFSDKTIGTGKTVSISDIAISGTDAGNYTLATSGQQTSATADITVKAVTVSGITANNKEYDGNTSAVLDYSGVSITGLVGTEVVTVTAVGTFSDIYIGTSKTVTISNIVLAGADAGNYVLASTGQQTSTTAHITGTVKFQYENTAKAADDITLVDSVPVTEPTLPLTENKIVAGWYNGNVLWNFADKVKVSMTLTVKISDVTSGATVIQADDKKAVDVELKTGTTSVKAILSDGTVSVSDLNSTDRLRISVEKDAASEDKFDVTVKLGDAVYTDKPIVITLQYDKVKGVPNAYYYPADGSKVKMDSSVDESAGTVTFTTTHNSVYGIEYTVPSAGSNTVAIVLCLVVDVLIVLGIAVYFVRHRN